MAYNAGTAFLQVVPSFAGVVTRLTAEATEWGTVTGQAYKASFESQVQDLKVGVEATGIPELVAEIGAATVDRTVQITPVIDRTALSQLGLGIQHSLEQALGAALGGALAGDGGGGGGGFLSALGWGGGLAGFAAFGSVLSLMGFGLEHFVITAIGLMGSAAAALAGGALLALGSLSVLGVGMLTDLGGIGQAAGDTKNVYTALAQYQTMQQGLAKQIPQTAAAQAALNTALAGFAPAAQSAVLAAALTASQFHWMYDQVTGVAEAIGANILNQAMQVGEKFLPTLGYYATVNMGIIQRDLQPLFTYLGTTGVGIFTNLEQIFTSHLPAAMNALNQGVQLLLNTINLIAPQTGNLLNWVSQFLTYLNTPAGWTKWSGIVESLITTFGKWWDLLKQILITIYDIFAPNVGLGSSIVTTVTSMLKVLDKWLTSSSGMSALGNLFSVHKTEILELLGLLGDFIADGGQIMLQVIPPFVSLANILLGIATTIMDTPILGTILAWAGAATLLWKAMNLAAIYSAAVGGANAVVKVLNLLPGVNIAPLATAATTFSGAVAEFSAAVTRFTGIAPLEGTGADAGVLAIVMPLASAAVIGSLIGLAIAPAVLKWLGGNSRQTSYLPTKGIDAGLYPANTSLLSPGGQGQGSTNWPWMFDNMLNSGPANAVRNWFKSFPGDIAKWWSTIPGDLSGIWNSVSTNTKNLIDNVGGWFKSLPGDIWSWVSSIPGDFGKLWTDVSTGAKNWLTNTLVPWFEGLPNDIVKAFGKADTILLQVGKDIVNGLLSGIERVWKTVTGWLSTAVGDLSSVAKKALGISSPSTVFYGIGQNIGDGLANGLLASTNKVTAAGQHMLGGLGQLGTGFTGGAVNVNLNGSNSVLAALQRIEAAIHTEGAIPTGAAISTKVDAKLGSLVTEQTRTALRVARAGG